MRIRALLALLVIAGLPCAGQSWRQLADQRALKVGAAVDPSRFGEAAYADTLAREFNQIEPENATKFGPIHPGRDTYNFTQPDQIVKFGSDHGMAVRGHTLVWHNQNPTWLTSGNFSPDEKAAILQSHIQTVVGRYKGRIYAWDVVNEAMNDNGTPRTTLWSDIPDYIAKAFQWAHDADPNALLFYNDYSAEGTGVKSDAIYAMAKDLLSRGVPIHGIGLQAHFTQGNSALNGIDANIKRLTDLGLQVQFTEFDVRLPIDSAGNATAAALTVQAQIYHDLAVICLKYPLCSAIQTWGLTDKYSWIPSTFAGFGAALPFDANYQPKPAYTAMRDALASAPPVITAAGLVDAASYAGGSVAPGEVVTLYGANFGPADLQTGSLSGSRLDTRVSGVRMLFDGVPAPILYAKVNQASAVVPFSVQGKQSISVQYEYQGLKSNAYLIPVVAAKPAVFALDASGRGPGAVLDSNYQVISDSNKARHGGVLLVYATGGGALSPSVGDGETDFSAGLPQVQGRVTATIGGVDCRVLYAGSAPGFVAGALQLNIEVAAGVPSGVQPLVVTIGGVSSPNAVTVLVE